MDEKHIQQFFVRFINGICEYTEYGIYGFINCDIYFPPNYRSALCKSYLAPVENIILDYPHHTMFFCSYFNSLNIKWSNDNNDLIYSSLSAPRIPCIPETYANNNFFQVNSIYVYTFMGATLDLVFNSIRLLTDE